ncbi:MAG: hypothetical protein WAP52_04035 [Candidatus Sungiibacteriota bacterium]
MREARYRVANTEAVEKNILPILAMAGATLKKWYALTDVIYMPRDFPIDWIIHARYVRWRIAHTTGQVAPVITVVDKKTSWHGDIKDDSIILRREFDAPQASMDFLAESYGAWEKKFSFSRTGREYALKDLRIFVEDVLVPGIRWSVEIEGADDISIVSCANILALGEPIRDSIPALVQKCMSRS